MNCRPTPEVTCDGLISDACVTISNPNIFKGCPKWVLDSGTLPDLSCGRQSELNLFFADSLCSLVAIMGREPDCDDPTVAEGIRGSIGLGCLVPCDPDLGAPFKPAANGDADARVNDEFQNVYTALCDLKGTLNNWGDLPLPVDFDLGCLETKCGGPPPTTLQELLEALISTVCNCCSSGN